MSTSAADPTLLRSGRPRVLIVLATRPDAIKMAPVYLAMDRCVLDVEIIATGQHDSQLSQALVPFAIPINSRLHLMRSPCEPLSTHFGRLVRGLGDALRHASPTYVLVHGDTLSCAAAAWASFLAGIPFAHVEAGLRTRNLASPFPEEGSRKIVDQVADLLLAPTPCARRNLLTEGADSSRILVTGQTVVDAVMALVDRRRMPRYKERRVVVTLHRRENWPKLCGLVQALVSVARQHREYEFILPMHRNPEVRAQIQSGHIEVANFHLQEPLDYSAMLKLLATSALVVTDSGGLQEECLTLGTPVVVVRETTERPEAIDSGGALLAGTDPKNVRDIVSGLLSSQDSLRARANRPNPFGDGCAGHRVAKALEWRLLGGPRPADWCASAMPWTTAESKEPRSRPVVPRVSDVDPAYERCS